MFYIVKKILIYTTPQFCLRLYITTQNPKPKTLNPKYNALTAHNQSPEFREKMNHIAAMEEQLVSERIKQKLNQVNLAAQTHLSPVQDHVNFTLQVYIFDEHVIFVFFYIGFSMDFIIKVSFICYGFDVITPLSAFW